MNCFDALNEQLQNCEPCKLNAFIIEFEELPEEQKVNFANYNQQTDYILHCELCKVYKLLPEPIPDKPKSRKLPQFMEAYK